MAIRFFNTYSREIEEFTPLDPAGKLVRMYTCGPTVYNHAHIGNFRAYVFEDLLQRHLEARGFEVLRVMNLTDVDDKTIRNSRAAGKPLADFTAVYKEAFFQDLDALRIKRASHFPAATEPQYIERMIAMIGELMAKGIAYQADDKSVYFRLSKFPDYGKLAHLNLEELRPSGRISSDEYEKESVGDFALWKAWDENDGDVKWDSPWGAGRPGWHIECSAMAMALLGAELDIHCGGVDNIFPHHEAEIAQSECCSGKKFVRFWLHCAHLMVEGQKMSKSAGNFYTLRDLLAKGWTGREIRYALLTVNYRLPLNFTIAGLEGARAALKRIDEWGIRILERAGRFVRFQSENEMRTWAASRTDFVDSSSYSHPSQKFFFDALDDDLNISGALGHLFDLIHETHRLCDSGNFTSADANSVLDWWLDANAVLEIARGLSSQGANLEILHGTKNIPPEVSTLIDLRKQVRDAKDWKKSDELRAEIAKLGWNVKDTKDGPKPTPL